MDGRGQGRVSGGEDVSVNVGAQDWKTVALALAEQVATLQAIVAAATREHAGCGKAAVPEQPSEQEKGKG